MRVKKNWFLITVVLVVLLIAILGKSKVYFTKEILAEDIPIVSNQDVPFTCAPGTCQLTTSYKTIFYFCDSCQRHKTKLIRCGVCPGAKHSIVNKREHRIDNVVNLYCLYCGGKEGERIYYNCGKHVTKYFSHSCIKSILERE